MVRILVADDHDLVRETIAAYLVAEGFGTVLLAAHVDQALRILAEGGPADLVLADYDMPGIDGLAGLGRLITANAPFPVALISGAISPDAGAAALAMGARGVMPKTLGSRAMVAAVRALLAGSIFAPVPVKPASDIQLSPRELDVLRGICAGKSNKEIARDCGLQEVTVKLHVKTMSRKLVAKNRTHAAMIARDRKLV